MFLTFALHLSFASKLTFFFSVAVRQDEGFGRSERYWWHPGQHHSLCGYRDSNSTGIKAFVKWLESGLF